MPRRTNRESELWRVEVGNLGQADHPQLLVCLEAAGQTHEALEGLRGSRCGQFRFFLRETSTFPGIVTCPSCRLFDHVAVAVEAARLWLRNLFSPAHLEGGDPLCFHREGQWHVFAEAHISSCQRLFYREDDAVGFREPTCPECRVNQGLEDQEIEPSGPGTDLSGFNEAAHERFSEAMGEYLQANHWSQRENRWSHPILSEGRLFPIYAATRRQREFDGNILRARGRIERPVSQEERLKPLPGMVRPKPQKPRPSEFVVVDWEPPTPPRFKKLLEGTEEAFTEEKVPARLHWDNGALRRELTKNPPNYENFTSIQWNAMLVQPDGGRVPLMMSLTSLNGVYQVFLRDLQGALLGRQEGSDLKQLIEGLKDNPWQ